MVRMRRMVMALLMGVIAGTAFADQALLNQPTVQQFIRERIKQDGFSKKYLTAVFQDARFQPKIIESMNKPYEKKPWDLYQSLFITPDRIAGGMDFWKKNQAILEKAERQFGVPAPIIIAIIGVETRYGKNQGDYRVIDALTTLAFNYPERAPYFTKELRQYLILCKEQHVPANYFHGSYAGAMGKPQFMPTSFRNFAIDFSQHGHIDLINDDADAIGSVANYLHHHGWQRNQAVATPAEMKTADYSKLRLNERQANYRVQTLKRAGVEPLTPPHNPPRQAGLIELQNQTSAAYWIAYPNFYVITRYNTSPQYAMAVLLLAKALKTKWAEDHRWHQQYSEL
jgi:membrane-bound lytic murein transglycosylase B